MPREDDRYDRLHEEGLDRQLRGVIGACYDRVHPVMGRWLHLCCAEAWHAEGSDAGARNRYWHERLYRWGSVEEAARRDWLVRGGTE